MKYLLKLANISIRLISERPLKIEPEWALFLGKEEENADLTVQVSWDWNHVLLPKTPMLGQDMVLNYYQEGQQYFCVSRFGPKGPVASVSYLANLEHMVCTVNEKPFISPPDSIGRIMRALPIREILLQFSALFFHAAQISYRGAGILFSAPSGTGKTTQARLWKKFRNAEIVCNDRTLVRKGQEGYQTYGFPLDGSEPVKSNRVNRLGAIVLLRQGTQNELQPLKRVQAVSMLMKQLVMDCWNPTSHERNMLLLLEMLKEIPVYLFTCTPDEWAVEVLGNYLLENGVITDGENHRPTLE